MIQKLIDLIRYIDSHRADVIDKIVMNSDTDYDKWCKLYRYYKEIDKNSFKSMKADNHGYEPDDELWDDIKELT